MQTQPKSCFIKTSFPHCWLKSIYRVTLETKCTFLCLNFLRRALRENNPSPLGRHPIRRRETKAERQLTQLLAEARQSWSKPTVIDGRASCPLFPSWIRQGDPRIRVNQLFTYLWWMAKRKKKSSLTQVPDRYAFCSRGGHRRPRV